MFRTPPAPLTVAGSLLLASVVPAVPFFLDPRPFRDVAGGPVHLALYSLTLAGLLALLLAVPGLARLTARDGRRLPGTALGAALLGTALNAATQFLQVFVTPGLADTAPAALDETSTVTMLGMVGSWLLFLAAWAVVGVAGLHRRILSPVAGVLLIIGAVAQPVAGPLAALPFGLALLLVGARARGAVGSGAPAMATA